MPSVNTVVRAAALVGAAVVGSATFSPSHASAFPRNIPTELMFGGVPRTYLLHVPAGLEHPNGLVINLHGSGMTGGQQAATTNFNAVADQHGFVVAYPDGVDMAWADGRGASVPDRQGVDDVGFLAALSDEVTEDFGIDPDRVYATGVSAGAFMANRFACARPDVVAAIAPVAGTLGSAVPCEPSEPVSVLEIHGTADHVVPFDGGPMVGRGGPSDIVAAPVLAQRWRELNDCPEPVVDSPAPSVHRFTATGCAEGTEVSFIQVDGGGHTWLDASQASAQFFATHGE